MLALKGLRVWTGTDTSHVLGVAPVPGGAHPGAQSCGTTGADAGLICPAGEMDEGQRVGGGACLPGHCVGGGTHYKLTVMVTSSDTLRLHSGELDGGQRMGCAKGCVDIVYEVALFLFLLYKWL